MKAPVRLSTYSTAPRNFLPLNHLQWLSRGGEDELSNLALVCPNHHRAVHGCDAPFDFGRMAFDFGTRHEVLKLNEHLGG